MKENYKGKLLISSPQLADGIFEKSLILICEHDANGSMGFILNKPIDNLTLRDVWKSFSKGEIEGELGKRLIFIGGPLATSSMFVIHSSDYKIERETLIIDSNYSVTGSNKIIEDIENALGPSSLFFSMGYSGWAPGQLEDELMKDSWFVCPPTQKLVFQDDFDNKWKESFGILGVDPSRLVLNGGST